MGLLFTPQQTFKRRTEINDINVSKNQKKKKRLSMAETKIKGTGHSLTNLLKTLLKHWSRIFNFKKSFPTDKKIFKPNIHEKRVEGKRR